ncbi:peroxiredoxin [Agromyces seonyuensis]|uniref:Alkyl hydroperoxide reductase E n=1 Tax=Agromyces seonyuensis TaxID=2662446 RepID=A0A6I4NUK6_9MICO|nr:peroxiredoxin [Agromyces seonyuensis]MWB97771.1 redoxin domain-containing protein [Agromyces seonyuensis]
MTLQIGDAAPDFALSDQHGQTVRLSDFRGVKPVTLVFYPLAFSSRCEGELCELRDNFDLFDGQGAELLAISVDSKHTLRAWAEAQGYGFRLLADFWPHGEVAAQYGVFLDGAGIADRATFVIGTDGLIKAAFRTAPGESRPLDAYREALAAL